MNSLFYYFLGDIKRRILSSRILDNADFTWEKWIIELCGIDYCAYSSDPKVLTMKILDGNLDKIVERIEELNKTVDERPYRGKVLFGEPVYDEFIYSHEQASLAYQILALLILETASFLPEKVKQEVLKSTTWEYDKRWGWSPDLVDDRKFFLKQFRRALRRYNGKKCFVENIPNNSSFLEKNIGIDDFINYLNSKYSFKKLLKAFSLKFLYLDMCQLETIPKEVFLCKNLEELSLSNNSLTGIPEEIGRLSHLKKLILSHNKISRLPDEIGRLKNLELLWVDDNQLTSLPPSLSLLNISDIDTSKNYIDA